jgi:hypothetical protein
VKVSAPESDPLGDFTKEPSTCFVSSTQMDTESQRDWKIVRRNALLGTPSVQSVHDYYPFAMEDRGQLAPMAAKLVDRMAILVAVRRFPSLAWVLLTLVLCALTFMSVCNISFVELLLFLFGAFGGMCGESSCNVFLLLFMVLWVPISVLLCRRADAVACLHVPRA